MKTTLNHLPPEKQEQIITIVDVIKEVVSPEKVILFGSYATGKWVEERYTEGGILYEYISDYDFLVVTRDPIEKEYTLVDQIVNRCRRYRTPVNPIVHSMAYVNEGLSFGQYFFTDILKEGILVYDRGTTTFAAPKELTPDELKVVAQRYFDQWFESSSEFLMYAEFAYNYAVSQEKKFNRAVFLLHQATEHLYSTFLLVHTGYKPKTHNLDKLRNYSKSLSPELFKLFQFPPNTHEKHLFDLLIRGYVDARYKSDYTITKEELSELLERVRKMQALVQRACEERIASLK
jgi:HEPN domain-containing protein